MIRRIALLALLAPFPAAAQDIMDAASLTASAPDMLMRGAVANCMGYLGELDNAIVDFEAAGWTGDTDDGGLTTLSLDEVIVSINPEAGLCRVESSVLGFADAEAVASDLIVIAFGGAAQTTAGEDGCPLVGSDAAPDQVLILSTGGNDPMCEETADGGAMITVLKAQN